MAPQWFIFSIADSSPRLIEALTLFDFHNKRLSYAHCLHETIVSAHQSLGIDYVQYQVFPFLYCGPERALQLTYTVPATIELRPLQPQDAKLVNDSWIYRDDGTEEMIRFQIETNDSVGAYDRASGDLIGWCVIFLMGSHSILQVRPQFGGRGLGKLIAIKLTVDRARKGLASHCFIHPDNHVSLKLFQGIGFEVVSQATWMGEKLK